MIVVNHRLRSLVSVGLPVAVAAVLVCLALVDVASVRTWRGEPEDGVLWASDGSNLVAQDVAAGSAGDRAGIKPRDVLMRLNGEEVTSVAALHEAMHVLGEGHEVDYTIVRQSSEALLILRLQPSPLTQFGLYYSLAAVGIFSIVIGAAVRLRRPADEATLHFFWLSVAFFGAFAFTSSGKLDHLDYFFLWADVIARLALPPLFLHFALVFPERPNKWILTDAGRATWPVFYLPAVLLGAGRAALMLRGLHGQESSLLLVLIEQLMYAYLAACLLGGLGLMMRALSRLRSVTARRQLRWIIWGSGVGAVPFVLAYVGPYLAGHTVPYAEYTAVLLGCIPLAFASAIVRYRLMDIEVIIKRALVATAVMLVLALVYLGVFWVVSLFPGTSDRSSFWALFATLVVVLVYPWLSRSMQAALDRLYYREQYDYRRALVTFARELNSDLDLERLSTRLVTRVHATLVVDKIALLLSDEHDGDFVVVSSLGLEGVPVRSISRSSALGARLAAGAHGAAGRSASGPAAGAGGVVRVAGFRPAVVRPVRVEERDDRGAGRRAQSLGRALEQ